MSEHPIQSENRAETLSWLIAALLPLVLLLPFLTKAYHIDSPFFLWGAEQILKDPIDFYGFDVNWYGQIENAGVVNKNPPLVSYYIALVALLFGWGEPMMHGAFLLPAIGASLGTYYLARLTCARPLLATVCVAVSPLFLLSASNIMAETPMFCFYVWSIALWVRGIRSDAKGYLFAAGVLAALAALTKYVGISAIPLLAAYTLIEKRQLGVWVFALALPVAALAGYEFLTYHLYGFGHISDTILFAADGNSNVADTFATKVTGALAFIGGGLIFALFFAPWFLTRREVVGVVVASIAVIVFGKIGLIIRIVTERAQGETVGAIRWELILQHDLYMIAGILIVLLAVTDLYRTRNADSALLFLWVAGIFFFSAFVNWTVSGRALLPLAPPAAILVIRRLEIQGFAARYERHPSVYVPLLLTLVISLSAMWADHLVANAQRTAAAHYGKIMDGRPGTLWYQGHWGWQWYADLNGGKHLETNGSAVAAGDFIVTPYWNTNVYGIEAGVVDEDRGAELTLEVCRWFSTWSSNAGTGFYASGWGPIPFGFTRVEPEQYVGYTVTHTGVIVASNGGTDESDDDLWQPIENVNPAHIVGGDDAE